ncbi:uncharacterized protein [Coffea arabica]|uniref:Uncharacterized protein n=1 Tax=Coffea arabica TaxID=13443 RepID=A0A6P6VT18_COFAR|nr:uncharacterized protein LOC113726597 [Coffea arabica]XP_027106224.1 uncharacterized protein LOC113726613 [Coffea arabica]
MISLWSGGKSVHHIVPSITMSAAARNSPYKLQDLVTLLYRYRLSSSVANAGNRQFLSSKFRCGNYMNQGYLRSFTSAPIDQADAKGKPDFQILKDAEKKVQPTLPASADKQSFSSWAKWLLGSLMTLLLPFWKQEWESLRGLEGKVEKVVGEVEVVAEVVENVATVTEKVSAEVAEKLPDNNKIKEAVLAVEHLSSVAAQEAKLIEDFIHNVGDMKQDLKEMEKIAEPAIEKVVEPHHQEQAA